MVPKLDRDKVFNHTCFRAVLFRMVPKQKETPFDLTNRFRAVLFRMVPKPMLVKLLML
ncbi:hypothetical protein SmuNN2025_0702 [Streptococcus mutans NN2025]|nr:hypothetical protein SmuNN2025_0702 [Streptococcus mutans NN2025]